MIGDKLKQLRINKQMSQEELASLLQLTPRTIIKYENNVTIPTFDLITKICDIFQITPNYFYDKNEVEYLNNREIIGIPIENNETIYFKPEVIIELYRQLIKQGIIKIDDTKSDIDISSSLSAIGKFFSENKVLLKMWYDITTKNVPNNKDDYIDDLVKQFPLTKD